MHDVQPIAPEAPSAVLSIAPRGNYILRHWRGANSLAWAFWINGVALNLIVAIVVAVFKAEPSFATVLYDPYVALPVLLAVSVFCIGMQAWQVVGIWRSAVLHKSRGGNRWWAVLASLMAALWCLSTAKQFVDITIPATEILFNYVRDSGAEERSVSVLEGGKEIELTGVISRGATSEVRDALDRTGAQILRLNSMGGRFGEAMKLLQLVRERHLVTYSSTGCDSACTIAFLGGKERWLSTSARLGFHRFSGAPEGALESVVEDQFTAAYEDLGLPPAFIERMLATPADDMWYPTIDELLAANLITGTAQPAQFADDTKKSGRLVKAAAPF